VKKSIIFLLTIVVVAGLIFSGCMAGTPAKPPEHEITPAPRDILPPPEEPEEVTVPKYLAVPEVE